MKKLLYLILFSLFLTFFSNNVYAAASCCSFSSNPKLCATSVFLSQCPSGQKACNPAIANKTAKDENGKDFTYHPDCFVAIESPSSVRITNFGKLFSGVVAFLLLVAFILSFFFLILGGISWLTSGGDKGAVENARNKIIAAIVGLIIVAATWALFQLVGGAIGFNILQGFEVPRLF